jgi:hypothetical protein
MENGHLRYLGVVGMLEEGKKMSGETLGQG